MTATATRTMTGPVWAPCAAFDAAAMLSGVTDAARSDNRPVLVAYDGSDESAAALRSAVTLFPLRTVIVVGVWEPGLARAMAGSPASRSGRRAPR